MVRDKNQPSNAVEWARRINRRWIVRGGLGDDAEAYLEHLAKEDPDRLM